MYERPSTDGGTKRVDSYQESDRSAKPSRDERELYGEPCHENESEYDEQTLYGEPQHETGEDAESPDPDLLFVHLRSGGATAPTASGTSESPTVGTTER